MRRVLFFMMTTANGLYEAGPWEIGWHNVDAEFNDFAIEQLRSIDTLLFGRATYQGMAAYWPTPAAKEDDPDVARLMNATAKVVFSRTLERADWENTRLVRGDAADEVARLKRQSGRDLLVMGSSDLAAALVGPGLIDELRIMVNPVFLGDGKPVLKGLTAPARLRLLGSKTFANGNVLLRYAPERPGPPA